MKKKSLLIEIAVAAAVLLILTVVMLPRFYQSQVRANLALTYQRMNGIIQANQAYKLDSGMYAAYPHEMMYLTTPIAYLIDWSDLTDPFRERVYTALGQENKDSHIHFYWNDFRYQTNNLVMGVEFYFHRKSLGTTEYIIGSNGPSNKPDLNLTLADNVVHFTGGYHLSNGLMSQGMILSTDMQVIGDN